MIKQVIHATNICGIEDLYKNDQDNNYLCCSSLGCLDYFHRDVLFLIEGDVTREYTGDIGTIGMSAKNTNYDELHVEGKFEILGLYIPNNMEFFDLKNYAIARSYINDILELPVDIINVTDSQMEIIRQFEEEISEMEEETYKELLGLE